MRIFRKFPQSQLYTVICVRTHTLPTFLLRLKHRERHFTCKKKRIPLFLFDFPFFICMSLHFILSNIFLPPIFILSFFKPGTLVLALAVETQNADYPDVSSSYTTKKVNIQCAFFAACTKNTLKKQDSSRQTPAPMSQSQHAWGRVKDPSHLRKRRCPTPCNLPTTQINARAERRGGRGRNGFSEQLGS